MSKAKSPLLEKCLELRSRGKKLGYSWLMKRRFRSWGRGSRVVPPLNVSCPWAIEIGSGVEILEHCTMNVKDKREDGMPSLTIGDGVRIGRFVHINAWHEVIIEPYAMITHRVLIGDETHRYTDRSKPICLQGGESKGPVRIGYGCWIGTGAIILPGVAIGRNAIVGANSVVTMDVSDFAVVAGVPARIMTHLQHLPALSTALSFVSS